MIRLMRLSRHGLRCLLAFVVFVATLAPCEAAASVNAPVLLRILTPRTGEMIHSNQDKVAVRLLVLPASAFQKGLQIRMMLDGKIRPRVRRRASFTMDHVYRGKHALQAALVTKNGRIVTVSPVVVFYLWHASRFFHAASIQHTR